MNNKYISTEAFGKVLKIFCANIFVVYFQYIYIYINMYIYIYINIIYINENVEVKHIMV